MSQEIPIWRIKYYPKNISQICGRDEIKKTLKNITNRGNFPHLLFIGSEGIGKTTLAYLFAKEFLGKNYNANFKIVYANVPLSQGERDQARSEAYISKSKIGSTAGRRITTPAFIQIKVKPFVQLRVLGDAPFKILIVKNFEALGSNQQGFRRLMETYGSNCRMILTTTKISSIIDPIISRCQSFLIPRVKFKDFGILITDIANKESLEVSDKVINILYNISEGKISKAIDILQLSSVSGSEIDESSIFDNAQRFQNDLIKSLLLLSLKGNFPKSRDQARKILSNYKYSTHKLYKLLLDEINNIPLSRYVRSKMINLLAEADFRALDGRDSDIQISALLSKICLFSENL